MKSAFADRQRRSGSISLEAAVIMVPLVIMMMAVFDISQFFFTLQAANAVAARVGRDAFVASNDQDYRFDLSSSLTPNELPPGRPSPYPQCSLGNWAPVVPLISPLLNGQKVLVCWTGTNWWTVQTPIKLFTPGLDVILSKISAGDPRCYKPFQTLRTSSLPGPGVVVCESSQPNDTTLLLTVSLGYTQPGF